MSYSVDCVKLNFRRPILICRTKKINKEPLMERVASVASDKKVKNHDFLNNLYKALKNPRITEKDKPRKKRRRRRRRRKK